MEASGAQDFDQHEDEQDAGSDGPVGNGVVIVVGVFQPGDVVSLIERGYYDVRAGLGDVVGRRVVDGDGQVGFAGLAPGGAFFACGYSGGRYEEVRCVAQDPAFGVTLFQPPVPPVPTMLGGGGTPAPVAAPAAPSEELEVGLPEGVESPLLTGERNTAFAPESSLVAPEAPEAIEDVAATAPEGPAVEAEPAPADLPVAADEPPVSDPAPVEAEAAKPGPEPTASESSGTGDQAGGAVEDSPVVAEPTNEPEPAAPVAEEAAASPADDPAPAPAAAPEAVPAGPPALLQLEAQAISLGIDGAQGSTDEAWLRQAITEKNVTPVA